jgi:MinD superfamily P-loop ATPase
MTVRVATVLSARDWEPDLVAFAREAATLRIVLRAFQPNEIADRRDEIDVVVAGADVAWVTPGLIASWRRLGLAVVGMYPPGDRPAAELLAVGGVDERIADDASPETIVASIRFAARHDAPAHPDRIGTSIAVLGDRGAPGCTEIALAVALNLSRRASTVLVDMDLAAPALAIRLGLAPRPDLVDIADSVRGDGVVPSRSIRSVGRLAVIVGSHRPGESPLSESLAEDVLEACLGAYEHVVVDLGAIGAGSPLLKRADQAAVVVDAGAVGIVRAAQLLSSWSGPPPVVVINRVLSGDRGQVIDAVRRWTGLEPAVVIPYRLSVRRASLAARLPDRRLRRSLEGLS